MEIKFRLVDNNLISPAIPDGWNVLLKDGKYLKGYGTSPYDSNSDTFINGVSYFTIENKTCVFLETQNVDCIVDMEGNKHPFEFKKDVGTIHVTREVCVAYAIKNFYPKDEMNMYEFEDITSDSLDNKQLYVVFVSKEMIDCNGTWHKKQNHKGLWVQRIKIPLPRGCAIM